MSRQVPRELGFLAVCHSGTEDVVNVELVEFQHVFFVAGREGYVGASTQGVDVDSLLSIDRCGGSNWMFGPELVAKEGLSGSLG